MCGRFINITNINKLKKIFEINEPLNSKKDIISYNIAPTQDVNIILNHITLNIEAVNWGTQFINKTNNHIVTVINSRLETVNEKILFKESFLKKRCLIPANGYYEWHVSNGIKTPYFIQLSSLETIYFAGIWKYYDFQKSIKKTFSILTKKANNLIYNIHQRMPVVMNINESYNYMEQKESFIQVDFSSIIETELNYFTVSKFVNSPSNNSIECIQQLN